MNTPDINKAGEWILMNLIPGEGGGDDEVPPLLEVGGSGSGTGSGGDLEAID